MQYTMAEDDPDDEDNFMLIDDLDDEMLDDPWGREVVPLTQDGRLGLQGEQISMFAAEEDASPSAYTAEGGKTSTIRSIVMKCFCCESLTTFHNTCLETLFVSYKVVAFEHEP